MQPEQSARQNIDRQLMAAGWVVQDHKAMNPSAGAGQAVREYPTASGPVDYMLFVDRKAIGVVEAKPEGTILTPVEDQSQRYIDNVKEDTPLYGSKPPFVYETTGVETRFRDQRDPAPRSRRVFTFHRPETLREWIEQPDTLRARLQHFPPLVPKNLRDCQVEAITNLERSFTENRQRALIQMATGSGKTFTAASFIYRLIKHAGAKRILFLVDRNNLGRQTLKEFQAFLTPDDGRKFTELYNVQHLSNNKLDKVAKVCVSTIQRVYSMLRGEELDPDLEEASNFDATWDDRVRDVAYNTEIPIETFDFIVTDECHRSIYGVWRQVLDYFDSFLIGLTATPSNQTLGFFNKNLVMEYNHERAVADGVNVGYEVYRIKTAITDAGSKVEAGNIIDLRDCQTRAKRWERLDEELTYEANQLDRDVVAVDQIRTVIRAFKDKITTEIFPGRTEVPKTLVFAKDDSHADDIVQIIREEFGKGNDFCKKITYRVTDEKPEDILSAFRNLYNPRIAVSVDMIATGTDIKPLECLLFMRMVRSDLYFEQMKGRGTRVIPTADLKSVTPDAAHKTHFVIVDAVGVCEQERGVSRTLERDKTIPFEKLLQKVILGKHDEDTLATLASRLARLNRQIDDDDRAELHSVSGVPITTIIQDVFRALDPDAREEKARDLFPDQLRPLTLQPGEPLPAPSPEQLKRAAAELAKTACLPFDNPNLRNALVSIRRRTEQTIDTVSMDKVLDAGYSAQAKEQARSTVKSFRKYIADHHDELIALQIIYDQPYARRHLTYEMIEKIVQEIRRPPYGLAPEQVWTAFERLEESRVRKPGKKSPQWVLTNLISLIRFAVNQTPVLEPFPDTVDARFQRWLDGQKQAGHVFTPEQVAWLNLIKEHIATSLSIGVDDFDNTPFQEKGGQFKAAQLFGDKLKPILDDLNGVLAA